MKFPLSSLQKIPDLWQSGGVSTKTNTVLFCLNNIYNFAPKVKPCCEINHEFALSFFAEIKIKYGHSAPKNLTDMHSIYPHK